MVKGGGKERKGVISGGPVKRAGATKSTGETKKLKVHTE